MSITEKYAALLIAKLAFEAEKELQKSAIGTRLKAARDNRRYTQQEAADRLGITRSQIANIETGKSGLQIENLIGFCLLYGISADELLGIKLDRS